MSRLLLVLWLPAVVACGPRLADLPSLPTLADGERIVQDRPIVIAVVGATEPDSGRADDLVDDIRAAAPDLVLLPGGVVPRSSTAAWRRTTDRWAGVAPHLLALPSTAEARGDRALRGFHHVFAGQGVADLGGDVTFTHADLDASGGRWRVVLLDARSGPLGDRWLDQLFWLPKVVPPRGYDHLLVLVNAPLVSLSDPKRADPAGAVSTLLSMLSEHAGPTSLMGVFMGDAGANELHLPGGTFSEAHVVAGAGSTTADDLWHSGVSDLPGRQRVELVDGFDRALRDEMAKRVAAGRAGPLSVERMHQEAFPSDVLPVRGWWRVELDGRAMTLAFRIEDPDGGYREIYRIRYSRHAGWVAAD